MANIGTYLLIINTHTIEAKLILPGIPKNSANENANEKEAKKSTSHKETSLVCSEPYSTLLIYTYMTFGHRLYDTYLGMFWIRKGGWEVVQESDDLKKKRGRALYCLTSGRSRF